MYLIISRAYIRLYLYIEYLLIKSNIIPIGGGRSDVDRKMLIERNIPLNSECTGSGIRIIIVSKVGVKSNNVGRILLIPY